MQPWTTVLTGVVLLFGAADQAWPQSRCVRGATYQCQPSAMAATSCNCGADRTVACRTSCGMPSGCKQEVCGKPESACGAGIAQKGIRFVPRTGLKSPEPRKLALPLGSYRRIDGKSTKSGHACGSAKTSACCADCRRDTIFGTETILGDDFSGAKPLAGVLSHLGGITAARVYQPPRRLRQIEPQGLQRLRAEIQVRKGDARRADSGGATARASVGRKSVP